MSNKKKQEQAGAIAPITFTAPVVGTVFTVLSGLSFLFLMMCLPLVGPAGAVVAYSRRNFAAFLAVLTVCTVFSLLALASKWMRRQEDGSPMPLVSIGLTVVCGFMFFALFAGWFSV